MTPDPILRDTEAFLHRRIPPAAALGIRVESHGPDGLSLTAPLELNYNHLGTAFGGSLAAVATLAGYTLLWLELGDREAHVVVQESRIQYLAPVREIIRACAIPPHPDRLATFRQTLAKSGKARLEIAVKIQEHGRTCVEFTGTFVAFQPVPS